MMLAKRIIPCLDVKDGQVVKGIQFRQHKIVGDIVELAKYYRDEGADELVFYDITASSDQRNIDLAWITKIARVIDIPFCVAGGIRTIETARRILNAGADKVSINSPAIERPEFINELAETFGRQCIVVGIDSFQRDNNYFVYQYTGDEEKIQKSLYQTVEWAEQVQKRGAGEIVLNCMNQDGVREGYDIRQLKILREILKIPLIASGGAGHVEHFYEIFSKTNVDGALAASVFHSKKIKIPDLKNYLKHKKIAVRL